MRIGSLFTGYGGLDMAVEQVFGAQTVWVSDIKPAAVKLLAHRHPDVPNLGDITQIDWATVEPVDIITGGFPCTDVSAAGRRAGLIRYGADSTRSGLWSEMCRAVDQLRPSLMVAENVRGLPTPRESDGAKGGPNQRGSSGDLMLPSAVMRLLPTPRARDGQAEGVEAGRRRMERYGTATMPTVAAGGFGDYGPAIARHTEAIGRPAPSPTEIGPKGGERLSPRFTEWMMGLPEGWITDVPGLSRNDQLSLCGDGVVPQQASAALEYLLEAAA